MIPLVFFWTFFSWHISPTFWVRWSQHWSTLRVARFLRCDVIACIAHFSGSFVVVNDRFTHRKDNYSSLPVDCALSIPVTYFEELVSCLKCLRAKISWHLFGGFKLEIILQSEHSTSELAGPDWSEHYNYSNIFVSFQHCFPAGAG